MPDQLAHILFARRVIARADEMVRARVNAASPAFRAGTFGPDPLFNDPSPRRRAEGFELHRRSGREALERMRGPVVDGMPWAADYAAGFFCHYALDRLCHPDIKRMAAAGEIRHVALETAYDRRLRQRGLNDLPRRILLSPPALRSAACMYQRLTPGQLRSDIEIFWQIRRFVAFGGGTPLAHVPGKFMAKLDGLIPYAENTPGIERGIDLLDRLMEEGVDAAAQQLGLYFAAIYENRPLDAWTDADFSGFQTQV